MLRGINAGRRCLSTQGGATSQRREPCLSTQGALPLNAGSPASSSSPYPCNEPRPHGDIVQLLRCQPGECRVEPREQSAARRLPRGVP